MDIAYVKNFSRAARETMQPLRQKAGKGFLFICWYHLTRINFLLKDVL